MRNAPFSVAAVSWLAWMAVAALGETCTSVLPLYIYTLYTLAARPYWPSAEHKSTWGRDVIDIDICLVTDGSLINPRVQAAAFENTAGTLLLH